MTKGETCNGTFYQRMRFSDLPTHLDGFLSDVEDSSAEELCEGGDEEMPIKEECESDVDNPEASVKAEDGELSDLETPAP